NWNCKAVRASADRVILGAICGTFRVGPTQFDRSDGGRNGPVGEGEFVTAGVGEGVTDGGRPIPSALIHIAARITTTATTTKVRRRTAGSSRRDRRIPASQPGRCLVTATRSRR